MKQYSLNLSVRRLREATESEYNGQVTLRTYDARAILALLGQGEPPENFEADPGEDDEIA